MAADTACTWYKRIGTAQSTHTTVLTMKDIVTGHCTRYRYQCSSEVGDDIGFFGALNAQVYCRPGTLAPAKCDRWNGRL